jgi:DNA-binding phage protein
MSQEGITSVRGFADQVGMSWKPIDKLLNGDPNPPLATLLQLAHALDLRSIEELLGPFETARILDVGRGSEANG